MTSILLLSEPDLVAIGLTLDETLALVEHAYALQDAGKADVPAKVGVHPSHPNSFLHAMPAWLGGERPAVGMKWVSYYPGNADRGQPDSTGIIVLNDPDTGLPLCMMEGMYITFLRTAACAAAAARRLAREPKRLGLVGCGGLGKWSLRFMRHVFPSLEAVYVSSRRPESREAFCAATHASSCSVMPVGDPREAVVDSDIVVTSVPPTDSPPVKAGMLGDDMLFIPLDVVNSWSPDAMQDFDCFVADSTEALAQRMARKLGRDMPAAKPMLATQSLITRDARPAKARGRMFVGVCGIASIDIAMAWAMYERATSLGLGTRYRVR